MNSITWLVMIVMLSFQFRTSPANSCFNEAIPFNDVRDSNGSLSSNNIPSINGSTAWCASDSNPYLQIDFGSLHAVCGVAIQGVPGSNNASQIRLTLSFAVEDTVIWLPYEEGGSDRVFMLNFTDGDVIANLELMTPQPARYVRFFPTAIDDGMEACIRVEVYGRPAVQVTCGQNGTVEVNLARGVIGPDISNLTLNDPSCSFAVPAGNADVVLSFSVDQCGTLASEYTGDDFLYFNNTVIGQVDSGIPTVTHDVRFPVICKYDRNDSNVTAFYQPVHAISSSGEGFGVFTFSFGLYIDSNYSTPYTGQTLQLRTRLFARVEVDESNFDKVVMVTRCWATPTSNRNDPISVDLIVTNCQDSNVPSAISLSYSCLVGSLFQEFSFQAFRFPGNYREVYIHCELRVCINITGNQCDQSCTNCSISGRKRRSLKEKHSNEGAEENLYNVDFPPFKVADGQQTKPKDTVRNERGILDTTGIIIMVISASLIVAVVCATVFLARRIHRKPACDRNAWAAQNSGYIHDVPAANTKASPIKKESKTV